MQVGVLTFARFITLLLFLLAPPHFERYEYMSMKVIAIVVVLVVVIIAGVLHVILVVKSLWWS